MAVKTNINFKGITIQNAYCSYQGNSITKQYHDGVKNYAVFCELHIFNNATKEYLLETDTIVFTVADPAELTQQKLWSEIKKKYPGVDV